MKIVSNSVFFLVVLFGSRHGYSHVPGLLLPHFISRSLSVIPKNQRTVLTFLFYATISLFGDEGM